MTALPPGAQALTAEEAIRRIKERDHVRFVDGSQEIEDALIKALREGWFTACLLADGQLAFTPVG